MSEPRVSLPWLRWVLLPTLFFGIAYLLSYWGTPLGMAPQLDAKENLAIAEMIAAGELPAEPMYRAMLYPAILALFLKVGMPVAWMPVVAGLFGMLCHVASALLAGLLTARLWRSHRAGLFGGLLYGLHPVAVYFAAIPLDITFATALFLSALWAFVSVAKPLKAALVGGSLLALAVLARPHFLPVAIAAPVIYLGLRAEWRPLPPQAFLSWVPCALGLLLFGLVNLSLSGEFRLLPWQGAYNLYSANKPEANGRYHAQSIFLTDIEPHENPTRLESEVQYARQTGDEPPYSIDAMNAHWREETLDAIRDDFSGWLGLTIRKAYYLLNNWEQYNNLTYAYHRQHTPWLRFNPIGWGILLIGATGGAFIALLRREKWTSGLLLAAASYAAGVGLFFVSARFRLPLAPLLCIFAAGLIYITPTIIQPNRLGRIAAFGVLLAAVALVTFSRFFDAADKSTYIQDESLIANAAAERGQDAIAYEYASRVLERDPDRRDAMRIQLISYFNMRLTDNSAWQEAGEWEDHREQVDQLSPEDPIMQFVAGTYHWQFGKRERAIRLWRKASAAGSGAAQAILVLIGEDTSISPDAIHPAMREQLERVLHQSNSGKPEAP